MKVYKRRRLTHLGVAVVVLLSASILIGGIYIFKSALQERYPSNMLNIETSNKTFGELKTYKNIDDDVYIMQYYPNTKIDDLDAWIIDQTDTVRADIMESQIKNDTDNQTDKKAEILQDYSSTQVMNRYISITLRNTFNGTLFRETSRVYDVEKKEFVDTKNIFKPAALRVLTAQARASTPQGSLTRPEYLNKINLQNSLLDLSLDKNILSIHFDSESIKVDLTQHPEYLVDNFGEIVTNDAVIPSTYLDYGVDPNQLLVAFTFDDGPHPKYTQKIVDILDQYNGHATFFMLGSRVAKNTQLVKEVMDRGNQVANHSFNHPNLTKMSPKEAVKQIMDSENALKEATGYDGDYYVRPPYGAITKDLQKTINRVFINWTVDSEDWKKLDIQTTCSSVIENVFDGSIVLMHDIHSNTIDVFNCVTENLHAQGYTFVTVTELLEARGIAIESGTLYRSGRE